MLSKKCKITIVALTMCLGCVVPRNIVEAETPMNFSFVENLMNNKFFTYVGTSLPLRISNSKSITEVAQLFNLDLSKTGENAANSSKATIPEFVNPKDKASASNILDRILEKQGKKPSTVTENKENTNKENANNVEIVPGSPVPEATNTPSGTEIVPPNHVPSVPDTGKNIENDVPNPPPNPQTEAPSPQQLPPKQEVPKKEEPPKEPTTPAPSANASQLQQEVLNLVNAERSKAGLSALSLNGSLNRLATLKSEDMKNKNYFDHNSPTYGSPFDMLKNNGVSYSTAGENIALGQGTAQEVMNSWMNSSGHRANILNPNFTQLGVGVAASPQGGYYWTQLFIKP